MMHLITLRVLTPLIFSYLLTASLLTLPDCSQPNAKESLAFPGAEGFGKYTTGGRGGTVLVVTNLNDSGPGSLREAIEASGRRYVLFAVSGTIRLESPLIIRNGDLTLAGQTAPGDGICISNYNVAIRCDNVIIRYLRFRMGDEAGQQDDALTCIRRKDIVIDHCSMSWATDECGSFYDNTNFTLQWSIISESLNHSVHAKGDHGYGGIWGGLKASFHHNLIAHHKSRLPRFCGSRYHKKPELERVEFNNNVIYNWMENSSYGGERGTHVMRNNYYKSGPATRKSSQNRIVEPYAPYGKFFVSGNHVAGFPDVTGDNWLGVKCNHRDSVYLSSVPELFSDSVEPATDAYESVLRISGASLRRDAVDERICKDVQQGSYTYGTRGIIDSQKEVGGWPVLSQGAVHPDTDGDGMPDAWEKAHKLDAANAADGSLHTLDSIYPNVEVYLNSLVEEHSR